MTDDVLSQLRADFGYTGQSVAASPDAISGSKGTIRVRIPGGRGLLPSIANGIAFAESGNAHLDDKGEVKTSKKGARGKMGLMPSSFPGKNIDDEATNVELGTKYAGELYDKYGNWDDALAAYNAGPGRVDKWIAAGRPESGAGSLPNETKEYVPAVLKHVGLSDRSPTATVDAKRRLTVDDMKAMLNGDGTAEAQKPPEGRDPLDLRSEVGTGIDLIDAPMKVLAHNFVWDALDIPLGIAQTAAEQVNPAAAQQLYDKANALRSQGEGAELSSKHPVIAAIGGALGTTMGIVAGGGAVSAGARGAATALPQVGRVTSMVGNRLGWLGKGVVGGTALGGALGATSLNPTQEQGQRVVEGVAGAIGGALISGIASAIYKGAQQIATREGFRNFVKLVQDNAHDVMAQANDLKARFVNQFDLVQRQKNNLYTLRNRAGEELTPGFDREAMGNPIGEAAQDSRFNGVAIDSRTSGVARQVDRELGGPEARQLQAEHEAAVKQWEKDTEAWKKSVANLKVGGTAVGDNPALLKVLEAHGAIEPPPVHPGEFEPPPVTPEQFAAARQAVQGARARTKDSRVKKQLDDLRSHLEDSARTGAEEAGMDIDEYLAAAKKADRFNKDVYAPIRAMFGDNPRAVDPVQFYDRAVKIIEGGRRTFSEEALTRFAAMLGPEGKQALTRVMAKRMFDQMNTAGRTALRRAEKEGPRQELVAQAMKVSDYIRARQDALRIVVGRDNTESLMGMANIAEGIARKPDAHRSLYHMLSSHGWLQAIGAARVGEGIFEGSAEKLKTGGALIILPWAGQILYNVLSKAATLPGLLPVVRRAAATAPNTREMERILAEFGRRMDRTARVAAAATGRETGPAARPLAPVGSAAMSLTGLQ